ncbi:MULTISPECIES: glycosyltransferase family 9 protein [unclassified Caballeronia]|uniref:glycosyltransferase family 9 protein n=1 Tax=unclassified Caballeronia TaxID=2646786 RepID=UPI00285E230C|nr:MULTISPECIES: glycosyltransferase family 9 protein [unclassified Caballeronia]MDR5739841.1 glycosyltransferase family 9 protein [Caballeronia sp. LZ016]MDR5808306.1 glycosyltransferase family 9 protein [Caballeronia sp. LZ019]
MRANPFSKFADALSPDLSLAPALIPDSPSAPPSAPSDDALTDAQYDELVAFHGIERERLVLIHPGSHHAAPAWAAEQYADVADQLAADGWQIAIIGDAPDPERTAGVLGAMQTAALFLAGAVAPRTLPRLIADAQLLLSDDAQAPSPVAVARALGTPHIVLNEHPRGTATDAIARRARAELSDVEHAHPGQPFTLHMPASHDAF